MCIYIHNVLGRAWCLFHKVDGAKLTRYSSQFCSHNPVHNNIDTILFAASADAKTGSVSVSQS